VENNWADFFVPTKIHFESDSSFKMGQWIKGIGSRVLLISNKEENTNQEELSVLKNGISKHVTNCILYEDIKSEPNTEQIDTAAAFAKKIYADVIVAYGGLNSIYTAKAVAILANNSLFASDLIIQKHQPKNPALPIVIVPDKPTLGEELTPQFILSYSKTSERFIYEHESLHPKACFYDSKIPTYINSDEAAKIGGALLAYTIEIAFSSQMNPISDVLIYQAMRKIKQSLVYYYQNPKEKSYITQMLWSSAMIGISLLSGKLGVSWCIAKALSTKQKIDFYSALCLIVPYVMDTYLTLGNLESKYMEIAKSLDEDTSGIMVFEAKIKAIEGVRKLYLKVNLPTRLSEYDIQKHHLSAVAALTMKYPQIKNAPRKITQHEVESILLAAF